MSEEYRNIYKTARRAAGLTQEAAAEKLGISVESVRAYETDQRIPSNEIVELMVICYNAQHLAHQHLRATNVLAAKIVPAVEVRSFMETAVRIANRWNRFAKGRKIEQLMEIAEDNCIDEEERKLFDEIMGDLREIVKSGLELEVFCRDGREDT